MTKLRGRMLRNKMQSMLWQQPCLTSCGA